MFIYKHKEAIEYVKKYLRKIQFYGRITIEPLGLRMRHFQSIIFI